MIPRVFGVARHGSLKPGSSLGVVPVQGEQRRPLEATSRRHFTRRVPIHRRDQPHEPTPKRPPGEWIEDRRSKPGRKSRRLGELAPGRADRIGPSTRTATRRRPEATGFFEGRRGTSGAAIPTTQCRRTRETGRVCGQHRRTAGPTGRPGRSIGLSRPGRRLRGHRLHPELAGTPAPTSASRPPGWPGGGGRGGDGRAGRLPRTGRWRR